MLKKWVISFYFNFFEEKQNWSREITISHNKAQFLRIYWLQQIQKRLKHVQMFSNFNLLKNYSKLLKSQSKSPLPTSPKAESAKNTLCKKQET